MTMTIIIGYKMGNAHSGNWGHEGRPGKEGGSLPTGKTHGAIPGQGGERQGGALRAEQAMAGGWSKPNAGTAIPLPQLSIPLGPVAEHEPGDQDGKADYQKWYQSQNPKPGLADALRMRKYFADRALQAESEAGQAKAEQTAADRQKRLAEEKNKPKVLTPAEKKKAEAAAKKAASAAASAKKKAEAAAKKKLAEETRAKKKAETEAKKVQRAAESAAHKKKMEEAAGKKKNATASAAAKKKADAAAKVQAKVDASNKVAESIGLGEDALQAFQHTFDTLKAGGDVDSSVAGTLVGLGLLTRSGDSYKVPSAARTLLSAILAGDALKARDAMDKLGNKEIGRVAVTVAGNRIIIG